MEEPQSLGTSFGRVTDAYESGRPTYPTDAVGWLLDSNPAVVVDVGAGTGKLTRSLRGDDRRVIAVDPDPAMLTTLRANLPDVTTHIGTAEHIPLGSGVADLVTLGQAWHWVDPVVACAEIGRVLRPGGAVGLIWNIRDESVAWVAAMSEIVGHSAAERMIITDSVALAQPFAAPTHRTWRWVRPITRAQLTDMVASRSLVINAAPVARERIDGEIAALFDSLPQLADGGTIDLPYTTHVYRAALA